jgi:hypothetical protein
MIKLRKKNGTVRRTTTEPTAESILGHKIQKAHEKFLRRMNKRQGKMGDPFNTIKITS